ncbi:MAG TPA: hypothetical protein VJ063_02800, partial [Verrucomicrobiae bacterium]|nr:hypothetical protein [Verrucomicrobiae bacterium]
MKWTGLALLVLCGCASKITLPPPKVSTAEFSVTAFPSDLYQIAWKGPAAADNERLLDLALLKASQVAQQHQLKYFMIVDPSISRPGEVKYRTTTPTAAEWNNELLIQGFKARPRRAFV